MNDFVFIIIVFFIFVCIGIITVYLYNMIATTNMFLFELSGLVSRTFREYYKGEDMEPVVINNGIDLVWTGEVDGSRDPDNKMGFITIMSNEGNINSPIKSVKEADIIAGKIMNVVYEYIKDREEQ